MRPRVGATSSAVTIACLACCSRPCYALGAASLLEHGGCAPQKTSAQQVECFLQKTYVGKGGVCEDIEVGEPIDEAVDVCGEVLPSGVASILQGLPFGVGVATDDVFFALGSGLGKLVTQVFLATPVRRAVGVEVADFRYRQAQQALILMQRIGAGAQLETKLDAGASHVAFVMGERELRFDKGSILATKLEDATIVFVANLAFPSNLTAALKRHLTATLRPGTLVVLMAKLVGCPRGLLLQAKIGGIATTLDNAEVYIYIVTTPAVEAEAMRSELPAAQKVPEGTWGGPSTQLQRLRNALSAEPRIVAFHRDRGGRRSSVQCDAQDLIAVSAQGTEAVDAILAAGVFDLERQDDQQYDILRHLVEEQSAVASAMNQFASEELRRGHADKSERLTALVNRVVAATRHRAEDERHADL